MGDRRSDRASGAARIGFVNGGRRRLRVGIIANSFVPGRGEHSGGFVHIVEVARRWDFDVVVFGPEDARAAIAKALPNADFVPARPIAVPSWLQQSALGIVLVRLACLPLQRRAIAACDAVVASTGFLSDVLPTLFARPGRGTIVVQHLQTAPTKRPGAFFGNLIAFVTERLGLGPARRNTGIVFYNDERDVRSLHLDPRRTRAVRLSHGVDHLAPRVDGSGPQPERAGALYVGRIHPTKGLDDLVSAWALVVRDRPNATLHIIGTGAANYRRSLDELVARLGLRERIVFVGSVTDDEKCRALERSRLFVFPSLEEGWGIAIAEAMFYGTPCITYDLDIYRDVFTQGRIAVARRDIESFAKRVIDLLTDDAAWTQLSLDATALASTFTWQRASDVYARALEDLATTSEQR